MTATPTTRDRVAAQELRHVLGHFCTGVTVVAALDVPGDPAALSRPVGFTCQSFHSLSLDPPLVSIAPGLTSTTWPLIRRARRFCVNVLAADQGELGRAFAVSGGEKFTDVDWRPAPVTGAPLIDGVLAWVDCTLEAEHPAGDHTLVIARVEALGVSRDADPLLFYRGTFR